MHQWAKESTYYHIVIDRYATGRKEFNNKPASSYSQQLREWMGGTILGVTQSLDYIEQLGIGVIMLSPFFQGKKYHGYWVTDFMQVDPHIGTSKQLRQLIEKAHKKNIHVIMDLPITHCHITSSLVLQSRSENVTHTDSWFRHDHSGNILGFYGDCNLPELNLDFPPVVNYLKKVIRYWLEFGIDGIRFDHAKRPATDFWIHITNYLRDSFPQVFLLGENWHESESIGSLSPYLNAELNIPLSFSIRRLVEKPESKTITQIIKLLDQQHKYYQQGYLLPTFLDNHDMERICEIASKNQPMIPLVFLLQLTLPYPPIIYYGSERAQSQTYNPAKHYHERDRYFREPMNWRLGNKTATYVEKIISLRNDHIDLFTSNPAIMLQSNNMTLSYSYCRDKSVLAIVINFSDKQCNVILPSYPKKAWLISDNAMHIVEAGKVHLLKAHSAAIFKLAHIGRKQPILQVSNGVNSSGPLIEA